MPPLKVRVTLLQLREQVMQNEIDLTSKTFQKYELNQPKKDRQKCKVLKVGPI
jgi:hypothetical protein